MLTCWCLCSRLHYVGRVLSCHPVCCFVAAPGSVVEEHPSGSNPQQLHHVLRDAYVVSGAVVQPAAGPWLTALSRVLLSPLAAPPTPTPTHPPPYSCSMLFAFYTCLILHPLPSIPNQPHRSAVWIAVTPAVVAYMVCKIWSGM